MTVHAALFIRLNKDFAARKPHEKDGKRMRRSLEDQKRAALEKNICGFRKPGRLQTVRKCLCGFMSRWAAMERISIHKHAMVSHKFSFRSKTSA